MVALKYKSPEVEAEWNDERLDLRVKMIALFMAALAFVQRKHVITITDVFRKKTTDSGIHEYWRAIDIRTKDMPKGLPQYLCDRVNFHFLYDFNRPHLRSAIFHNVTEHPEGWHIHLQVST